jgi:sugar phosphate isomerase/epimerase
MQICGRGDINLVAFCKNLVDGGYSGPVCLEIIGALQLSLPEVVLIASESYGYLNAIFKQLGVR